MQVSSLLAAVGVALGIVSGTTTIATPPAHCVTITRTLFVGSTGVDVSGLQTYLGVRTTGYFGPITKNALVQWQIKKQIILSARAEGAGRVGPLTRALLSCAMPNPLPTPPVIAALPKVTASTTATSSPTLVPPTIYTGAPSTGSGQGGGSASAPAASNSWCQPFTTPKPAANSCSTGNWFVGYDEAGCDEEWICDDPGAQY